MEPENYFLKCAAIVIVVIAICITTYNIYSKHAMQKMVEAGANPMDIACADSDKKPVCMVYLMDNAINQESSHD